MIIPADAVVFDQNGLHVAVVKNGTAHLQKITIARDFGRWRLAGDKQLDRAVDTGTERAVRIGNVNLVQERSAAGLQRTRYAGHLAGKRPIRNLRDANHGVNTGSKSERLILRDKHLGTDHIRMHQREHEGRSRRHEAAVVDVALCDHAVERRHDALVGLLLLENSNLGLLRAIDEFDWHHVEVVDRCRRGVGSYRVLCGAELRRSRWQRQVLRIDRN